ncbi:MAG TPA: transcription-repair coupling factor [Gammaproteobacteria bacterium]|nr:transcription-repair coupling factor [Gammaproteobacteria bacterium]
MNSGIFAPPRPQGPGAVISWRQLHGSAESLAITQAALAHAGPVLVLTPDTLSAERLLTELQFFLGRSSRLPLLHFPDRETLPYDQFAPAQDVLSDRLAVLSRLPQLKNGIVVTAAATAMHRLCPRSYVEGRTFDLRRGQQLDREDFRRRLEACGYRAVPQVMEHGEFAIRGSLIDVFPMGVVEAYRIDLLDDVIDSLRTFEPETQCSTGAVESVQLLPAREFPLDAAAISTFRQSWRARFEGNPAGSPLYSDVSQGLCPAGMEYYLPLFFDRTSTLFDYLPQGTLVVEAAGVAGAGRHFWEEIEDRHEQGRHDVRRPLLPPTDLFMEPEELSTSFNVFPLIKLGAEAEAVPSGEIHLGTKLPPTLPVDVHAPQPFLLLRRFLDDFPGRVLLVAESGGRRETLLELMRGQELAPELIDDWPAFMAGKTRLGLTVAPLFRGALIESPPLAVVSEVQLFGERAVQQRRARRAATRDPEAIIRDLAELRPGSPVVHEQHGVGRYRGLITLTVDGIPGEFLHLEYAGGDKLYVPVAALQLISRYAGVDPEHAPLHKLGSNAWAKARRRAAERVRDVAAELLALHAQRAARQGHAFTLDRHAYSVFTEGFPFEETPDQARAIDEVVNDMTAGRPMDRLICGDAGFGKTEVAMRAAFVAVHDGRQVLLLVPTTLLAQQHVQTFKDRFADWPVRVENLSRFRSRKEQTAVMAGLADGTVDIVIGTHKLLASDLRCKRLGLVIIDEEHRFGVRQKERLKALRAEVDVLTLTATPIPRTLNLALTSVRDLSLIATPPARRQAVKTFLREWDDGLLREALLREIGRGGQVFFLHNDVDSIEEMARKVATLLPEARVRVAHGQMRERDLERVMLDFYHRHFNVLVCTTIIETGIDIPTANTLIIHRADKFGLAQLYQLRGRVGRSHHRAYAYLLVPSIRGLSADAARRLEAVAALEELGVGFTLATHDLEIRGAGEILGEEQSGHIQEIGYGLYMELLDRAVASLRSGKMPAEAEVATGVEIELHAPALFPADYLPDVHARLMLYKRIAGVRDAAGLITLREEVIDRFGHLPEPALNLFRLAEMKLLLQPLGIRKVDLGERGGRVLFHERPNLDPQAVLRLIQQQPKCYRLDGADKLRIIKELPEFDVRIEELRQLVERFGIRRAA